MLLRLQLISTGKFFVLKKDSVLSIEVHTTIFNNQDDFFGSFSYPGEMPLEPNRATISNAHYIATDSRLRTVMVIIWLGYLPYKQVKMTFTISGDNIEYILLIDSSLISKQLTTLKLWQLYLPDGITSEVFIDSADALRTYMNSSTTAKPGTMPMVFFPYRDDGAYKPVSGAPAAMAFIGSWDASSNTPRLHDNSAPGVSPPGAAIGWVYKVTATGNQDLGSGPQNYFAGQYAVYDGTYWYPSLNPYGVRIAGQSADVVFPVDPLINRWEMDATGAGSFKLDPQTGAINQTQTPFFFLVFIIKRVMAFFGFTTIEGKFMTEDYANSIVIWTRVSSFNNSIIGDCTYFMPDLSCSDFLKEIRIRYGLMIDFDLTRNIAIVESLANLEATEEVVDLRDSQLMTGYRESANTTTWYLVTQATDSDDKAFPDNFVPQPMQIGDPTRALTETDITLASVATNMVTETAASDAQVVAPVLANWRIPYIKQPIYGQVPLDSITTVTYADTNNFKLRFLIWHGMQPNTQGFLYPYGSSDNFDVNGVALTPFTLSMAPAATDVSSLLNYYTFLVNSKPFEMDFLLTPQKLMLLRANKRFLVKDPWNFSTVSAIVDTDSFDLGTEQTLIRAKMTLYPRVVPSNTSQVITTPVVPPPPPPFDNGIVYARLVLDNQTEIVETMPTEQNSFYKDITVYFYSDSAGTVPKPVTRLTIGIQIAYSTIMNSGTTVTNTSFHSVANGVSEGVQSAAPVAVNETDGSGTSYVWVYTILPSAFYTVIP